MGAGRGGTRRTRAATRSDASSRSPSYNWGAIGVDYEVWSAWVGSAGIEAVHVCSYYANMKRSSEFALTKELVDGCLQEFFEDACGAGAVRLPANISSADIDISLQQDQEGAYHVHAAYLPTGRQGVEKYGTWGDAGTLNPKYFVEDPLGDTEWLLERIVTAIRQIS